MAESVLCFNSIAMHVVVDIMFSVLVLVYLLW